MSIPPVARAPALLAALVVLFVTAGCGRSGAPATSATLRLLDGGQSAPQSLVESAAIAWPPERHGNRFVSGWSPIGRGRERRLVPNPGAARLEWIRLADGPRKLQLDLELGAEATGRVAVAVAGRPLGDFPLRDPLQLDMPADLPLGKITVDFDFGPAPGAGGVAVAAAAVAPSAPAGELVRDGERWRQSGNSALDFYVRTDGGEAILARFEPPASPRSGQRFELRVERESGPPLGVFRWTATLWARVRGARDVRIPLDGHQGHLRVRLLALGAGPPASWRGLAVAERAPQAPPPAAERAAALVEPPRLLLLYVFDALRADHVGFTGSTTVPTPNLDRLAAEGVAFVDHWSVAPNTLPSTKALLTGELPHARERGPLPREGTTTLAEHLRAAGYRTALVSSNPYVGPAYGMDRGFDEIVGQAPPKPGTPVGVNDHAERIHAAALAWLDALRPGERAFLYLHVLNPHNPYAPPAAYLAPASPAAKAIDGSTETLSAIRQLRRAVSPSEIERLRELYRASVAYADTELGRFVDELGRRVPPGETVIAATSDHGEELFEHGGLLHGFTLYDEQLRIPLLLWAPGRLAPRRVEVETNTLDLHRTLRELAGLAVDPGGAGESLLDLDSERLAERVHPAVAASLSGGIYAVRSPRLKAVWAPRTRREWGMGEGLGRSRDAEYLFDRFADPGERENRAGDLRFEAEYLRGVLDAWLEAEAARRVAASDDAEPDDPETLARLRALGYL